MVQGRGHRKERTPLYREVAGELRDRIKRGVYGPGQRLPAARELVREFRVSAITVRRAVHDLRLEGLLQGRRGAGIFVRGQRRILRTLGGGFTGPVDIVSIDEVIRRTGEEPGLQQLSMRLVPAPAGIAELLQIPTGQRVYRHEKIVRASGEAVGVDIGHIPRDVGERLGSRLASSFAYQALQAVGEVIASIEFTLEGDTLPEPESRLLGLPAGFPALVLCYTPMRPDGRPLMTGRSMSRGDRFTYAFRLRLQEVAPPAP